MCVSGKSLNKPKLPTVAGDEGTGEVMETGCKVTLVKPGDRVVLGTRQLGTWTYYGVYHELQVYKIPKLIPLAEASMLTVAPISAYAMLHNFKKRSLCSGDFVVQNGANSAVGQSVIQICKAMGVSTLNIVANHKGYESVKKHLLSIGATKVFTIDEAEDMACSGLSYRRPTLALNCLGGRDEAVQLLMLERNGDIVNYDAAYSRPFNQSIRRDVGFHKFLLADWNNNVSKTGRESTFVGLQELIAMRKFQAPNYEPIFLKNYVQAFRNTSHSEAYSTKNFVFDFTVI